MAMKEKPKRRGLFSWFPNPFNSNIAQPGSVLLGPSYKSHNNVFMGDSQVVDAVKIAIDRITKAIDSAEAHEVDEAIEDMHEARRALTMGLPPEDVTIVTPKA